MSECSGCRATLAVPQNEIAVSLARRSALHFPIQIDANCTCQFQGLETLFESRAWEGGTFN